MTDLQTNKISNKLETKQIIEELLAYTGLKPADFLRRIGANPTAVSNFRKGKTTTISKKFAEKIRRQWPEVSESWLILGEGPMLSGTAVTSGDNSQQRTINGNNNLNSGSITNVDERLLKIIEENQQERLKLLTIIENLTR